KQLEAREPGGVEADAMAQLGRTTFDDTYHAVRDPADVHALLVTAQDDLERVSAGGRVRGDGAGGLLRSFPMLGADRPRLHDRHVDSQGLDLLPQGFEIALERPLGSA